MKKLLTLILCWLLAFSAMAENTFKAYSSASVAGGYITSLNKVDGSFEDGTSQWLASADNIVKTASTEMQGNNIGAWTGAGAQTLDLQWIATASNTYEASAQVDVQGEDDVYVCAYVGTTETGCKLIPALSKIQKVSVVADSVLGSAFYLRLKHTGSDAFSVKVDDGKIEPWTPQAVNLVEQESAIYYGNAGGSNSSPNGIQFSTLRNSSLNNLGSWDGFVFKAKKKSVVNITANIRLSNSYTGFAYLYVNRAGVDTYVSLTPVGVTAVTSLGVSGSAELNPNDTLRVVLSSTNNLLNTMEHLISITASAISENVVQSYAPSDFLGEIKLLPSTTAPKGFIPADGKSIGKSSGNYQGDAYYELYKLLWTQSSVTAGEPYVISSAKGPDALTDWNAAKTITIDVSGLFVRAYKSGTSGAVGAKQADAFQGHKHQTAVGRGVNDANAIFSHNGNVASTPAGGAPGTYLALGTGGYFADGSYTDPRYAAETRPTNIAQYAFIRYGNDAPTLIALPTSKENVFSANISSSGGITSVSSDFISSISLTDTSLYTINFKSGVFSVSPSVSTVVLSAASTVAQVTSISASSVSVRVWNAAFAKTADAFSIRLQKQGADYTAPGVFISNLNPDGFNKTNGVAGLVDSFSFSYGTTNATTVCSASPCSYLDQIGNYVTSVTRSATGIYSVNFTKTFAKLKCGITSGNGGVGHTESYTTSCSSCSSLSLNTILPNTGANADTFGTLLCQGQ